MALTLAEIRGMIRRQTDTDTDDITDADIDYCINLAKNKVDTLHDWPYLQKSSAIAVSAGATTVTLPGDYAFTHDARWNDTGSTTIYPLIQINPDERPLANDTSGTPQYIWTFGGVMSIWRPPANNGTLTLEYYKVPTELTADGHTPEWDSRFHRMLYLGGLVEVYQRIDFWEEARIVKADFDEQLARMDLFYMRSRQPIMFGQRAYQRTADGFDIRFNWEN